MGEQLLRLAQSEQDRVLLLQAHLALGFPLLWLGNLVSAHAHLAEAVKLYDPLQDQSSAFFYGQHSAVVGLSYEAWALWQLGYPQQALERSQDSLLVMEKLSHPFSLAMALCHSARFHQLCREERAAQERAERVISLAREQGFPFWVAQGTIVRGWALAEQGQVEEGIEQIQQGLSARQVTGGEAARPWVLAMLAEAYGKAGQIEEGLTTLAEALAAVDKTGERFYEAELYRLKGELTLQKLSVASSRPLTPNPHAEVEACFLKAIEVAQKQQAKSLELRAVMSLARLWQQQGRKAKAHKLLSDVYNWFTEGFDTKDLQEAKALLESLESGV